MVYRGTDYGVQGSGLWCTGQSATVYTATDCRVHRGMNGINRLVVSIGSYLGMSLLIESNANYSFFLSELSAME